MELGEKTMTITELKELLEKATPGPVKAEERGAYNDFDGNSRVISTDDIRFAVVQHHGTEKDEANTELFVRGRNALPALIEAAENMAKGLEDLRDCNFVITPMDRMDAVREIARKALQAWDDLNEEKGEDQ